jgi:hypothetical protein
VSRDVGLLPRLAATFEAILEEVVCVTFDLLFLIRDDALRKELCVKCVVESNQAFEDVKKM